MDSPPKQIKKRKRMEFLDFSNPPCKIIFRLYTPFMARHDRFSRWTPVIAFDDIPVRVLLDIINEQINSARDSLSAGIELEENSSGRSAGVLPHSMPIH